MLLGGLLLAPVAAQAATCDLDEVLGYRLVASKVVEGWLENGREVMGFEGCQPGRVLVFTDHTGVRCKDSMVRHVPVPKAFIFVGDPGEIKACIGDQMYSVVPAN